VITRIRKSWLAPHREPRINEPRKQDQFFTALPIFEKQSDSSPDFSPALPEGRGFNPAGDESPLALLNFHALDSSSPRAVQRVTGD